MRGNTRWWHRLGQNALDYGHQNGKRTNYVDEFIEYPHLPVTSFKPNRSYQVPNARMAADTTFKIDYQPHELQKHELPPKLPYIAPSQMMQTSSMYTQDYPGKSGAPALPIKPKHKRPTGVKFDAVPTYSHDYRTYAVGKPDRPGPNHSWAPPTTSMNSETTFKRDFTGKYQPKRESSRPAHSVVASNVPIDGLTTQKVDFVPHALERRTAKVPLAYKAPGVPMQSSTTQRESFNEKQRSVRESLRPPRTVLNTKEPLSGASEQRDRYIAWQVDKPQRHEYPGYRAPEGAIDLQTTTGIDFVGMNGRPAESVKPLPKRSQLPNFDGNTNYSNDFKVWPIQHELHRPERSYVRPEVPFDGTTTFANHFKANHGALPSKSCKPGYKLNKSQPLDGTTIYNSAYIPKSLGESVRYPTPEWMKQREGKTAAAVA